MSRRPAFITLVAIALADQWANVRTLTVRKLTFLTFFEGLIVLLAWFAASLLNQQAAFAPYGRLATILFFGLLTASWIAIALQQISNDLADRNNARQQLAGVIASVPTILIAGLLTWSTVSLTFIGLTQPINSPILDYASCVSGGGLVLQTNPAQCITTTNTFTDPRGVQ